MSSPTSRDSPPGHPRLGPRRKSILKRMKSTLLKTFSNEQADLIPSAPPARPPRSFTDFRLDSATRQSLVDSPSPPIPSRSPKRPSLSAFSMGRPSLAPLDTAIASHPLKEQRHQQTSPQGAPTPPLQPTAPLKFFKPIAEDPDPVERKRPVSQPNPKAVPLVRPKSASSARNSLTPQQRAYFLASAPPTPPPTSPLTTRSSGVALKASFRTFSRPPSPPETADAESQRLTFQHQAYKRACGGITVHPSLLPRMSSMDRIFEVGSGNGVWLDDLRNTAIVRPDTQLHGSDIAIPPAVPPTVDGFIIHDITQSLPEAGISSPVTRDGAIQSGKTVTVGEPATYDFVHARLLVYALEKEKWPLAIDNMAQLLKPGGALQISEVNCVAKPFRADVPHPQVDRVNRIATRVMTAFNKEQSIADRMPSMLVAAGLHKVRSTRFEIPFGQAARAAGQTSAEADQGTSTAVGAIAALRVPFLAIGGEEGCRNDEDFTAFEHDLREEIDRLGMTFTFVMTVGEKR